MSRDNRQDPFIVQRSTRFRRLYNAYLVVYVLAIGGVMYGLFWGATHEPTRTLVFKSFGSVLIYALVGLLLPVVMRLAFPPPFTKVFPGETPYQRLKRERVMIVVLAVIAGTIFSQILFLGVNAPANMPRWVGWVVVGAMLSTCSYMLWPYQAETWRQVRKLFGRRGKEGV